jgi:hypothetical protein
MRVTRVIGFAGTRLQHLVSITSKAEPLRHLFMGYTSTRMEGSGHPHKTNCHVSSFRISLIQ